MPATRVTDYARPCPSGSRFSLRATRSTWRCSYTHCQASAHVLKQLTIVGGQFWRRHLDIEGAAVFPRDYSIGWFLHLPDAPTRIGDCSQRLSCLALRL